MAIEDPHQSPPAKYTFMELHSRMCQFASGLQEIGLKAGDIVSCSTCFCASPYQVTKCYSTANATGPDGYLRQVYLQVSLFSDNSSRWLIADQSIMMLGAADAVRIRQQYNMEPKALVL